MSHITVIQRDRVVAAVAQNGARCVRVPANRTFIGDGDAVIALAAGHRPGAEIAHKTVIKRNRVAPGVAQHLAGAVASANYAEVAQRDAVAALAAGHRPRTIPANRGILRRDRVVTGAAKNPAFSARIPANAASDERNTVVSFAAGNRPAAV